MSDSPRFTYAQLLELVQTQSATIAKLQGSAITPATVAAVTPAAVVTPATPAVAATPAVVTPAVVTPATPEGDKLTPEYRDRAFAGTVNGTVVIHVPNLAGKRKGDYIHVLNDNAQKAYGLSFDKSVAYTRKYTSTYKYIGSLQEAQAVAGVITQRYLTGSAIVAQAQAAANVESKNAIAAATNGLAATPDIAAIVAAAVTAAMQAMSK